MLTKIQLNSTLEKMPNEFSIDELIENLLLVEKINKGIQDSNTNNILSEAQTEEIISKWFQ